MVFKPTSPGRLMPWRPSWMLIFYFTTKKHALLLAFATLFSLIASVMIPAFAVVLGEIFNFFTLFGGANISATDLIHRVSKYCVVLAGIGAAGWVCNAIYFILFMIFGELQVTTARDKLLAELFVKDQEWFETQPDGTKSFLSGLQSHLHELQMATSQPLGLVLQYSFRTILSLALAFYTSWDLTLVTLAGIPVFSAIIFFLSSKMKPSIEKQQADLATSSKTVNSTTSSIDTVKCLNAQDLEFRNFSTSIDRAAQHYLKQACLNSFQIATLRLMMFSMFVQGFWYGATLATSGKLSSGEVLRTFWACLSAAQSIEMVMPQAILLEKGKIASSAMKGVLDNTANRRPMGEMKGAMYPHHCEGDIEVSNLSFSYSLNADRLSLDSVSFFFPAGETTYVIGRSGSGKSTLGQLLAQFYRPTSGEILIDGYPTQTLSTSWIRNNVTYVEQRSVLFNESIFMNIAFGRRDGDLTSKDDIQECIEVAMLQSTIDNLPNGIDTCAGNGGSFLSGGQRQRVAIARARLRDTPILILDEPTSALDGLNRVEVMRAIREWRKGKTTIIITHDMAQIQEHDFVYVMEQGSVIQAGYRYELQDMPETENLFASVEKETLARKALDNDEFYFDWETSSESSMDEEDWTFPDMPSQYTTSRPASYHRRRQNLRNEDGFLDSACDMLPPTRPRSYFHDSTVGPFGIPMYELDILQTKGSRARSRRVSLLSPVATFPPAKPMNSELAAPTSTSRRKRRRLPRHHKEASLRRIMMTIVPSLTFWQKIFLLLGCLCALMHACATPVFSYCLSQLLGSFYKANTSAMKWALAVLGVAICDGTVSFFMHYLLELCGQAWVDCLRKRAFGRVLDQPRKWFESEENTPSQLTACLGQDGEEMRNLVGRFGGYVLVAVSISVMAIIWSLVVCWKLTLVALACGPIIYAITRGFERTSGLWEKRCNEAKRVLSEIFVETFSEIRTVRTLTLEPFFHRKYLKAASKCLDVGLRRAGYTGILFGLVECTIIFVSALIFYYGAVLVTSPGYAVEDIMTVFSLLLFSIGYASTVLSWIPQISTSRDMGTRLLRLANLPEGASHEHMGDIGVAKTAPVKITQLSFHYPSRPEAPVLRNVSLVIPEDSCTAIVGRSGSGKSTIASLLLSLYEAPSSRQGLPTISLAGVDIRRLHTPTLRSLISIVSQQPTIFPGTIAANICYGLDEASPLCSMYNVQSAARAAGIDDFVSSLPNSYQTVIGDGGMGLSGGQAQRVVIARALVRRPQILIMDEATSALDPASADVIRQTVQELVSARRGLTVVIITHAKEMMEIADNVIVMEQGQVVESGSYRGLVRRAGGKLRALIEDG